MRIVKHCIYLVGLFVVSFIVGAGGFYLYHLSTLDSEGIEYVEVVAEPDLGQFKIINTGW